MFQLTMHTCEYNNVCTMHDRTIKYVCKWRKEKTRSILYCIVYRYLYGLPHPCSDMGINQMNGQHTNINQIKENLYRHVWEIGTIR
jgi:hypothetical protein